MRHLHPGRRPDGEHTSPGRATAPQAGAGQGGRASLWKGRKEWAASGGKDGRGLRGTGFALGGWLGGLQPTSATVRLNPDGSLNVLTGQVDIAGHQHLTGPDRRLRVRGGFRPGEDHHRRHRPPRRITGLTAGSKTIYTVGTAVLQAAQDARRQTFEIAAKEMEASVHDLEIRDGQRDREGRARQVGDAGVHRQEGQSLHVQGPARARDGPPGLLPAGPGLCRADRADRGGPGHRRDHAPRLRGHPGRRQGHQPARRGRPDAGRRRAEPRHGDDRGLMFDEAGD